MHRLITTEAVILHTAPRGESNRVYKVLTRELGLLYAHGQGVREIKSRNRYALQTGEFVLLTLVRGREVWRITGARAMPETVAWGKDVRSRKVLTMLGRMIAVEDPSVVSFDVLVEGCTAIVQSTNDDDASLIEAVTLLRLLDALGYVPRPVDDAVVADILGTSGYGDEVRTAAALHKRTLFGRVNTALLAATP
jgi:recombinational DNA repair protein (RecF pathway)